MKRNVFLQKLLDTLKNSNPMGGYRGKDEEWFESR